MTIKEIIDGLKFTVDMYLFDPDTGKTFKEPRNKMSKITVDACKGAIELLEQTRWIPVSEKLPEANRAVLTYIDTGATKTYCVAYWNDVRKGWEEWTGYELIEKEQRYKVLAWQLLPQPYKAERHTCGECQELGTVNCPKTYREPTKNDGVCESFKAEREE